MANVNRILVPTDFSPYSQAALALASQLAQAHDARLLLVHVLPMHSGEGEGLMHHGVHPEEKPALEAKLAEVAPTVPGVPHTHELLVGDPAPEIVALAEREGVDLIVLGTHGRSGLSRLLMGSTAEVVLRRASCAVILVKPSDVSGG